MFNPFSGMKRIADWFSQGVSIKAKILIAIIGLFVIAGLGVAAYKINHYAEHDPNACMMCHVHDDANKKWAETEHKTVTCHVCHQATRKQQIIQMYRFAFLGQKTVEPRHGEIIVAWKICYKCHWERNEEEAPKAKLVNRSRLHARHVFMEQIECSKCHGYITHQFTAEARFCVKCHQDKEVHGIGMEEIACLNCHTDRTADLMPGPNKCLFCHGSEKVRERLIADGTLDVIHNQPDKETIDKAKKINRPEDAPMQFYCYQCHKPHVSSRPNWGDCLNCHRNIINVGQHGMHIEGVGMKCKQCHKPHVWRVTPQQAKKECVTCHGYKEPKNFLRPT